MRVLHFYKTYYPDSMGGIEQVINQIACATISLGVHTDVLSLTSSRAAESIEMNGYQTHRSRMTFQVASTGFSISVFLQFIELARRADIIHYHYPWPFMDVVHFMTRVKKPSIVTYHSDIVRQKLLFQLYKPLNKCFLSSVNKIVATSPNYLETSHVLNKYRSKTIIIPIGLDKSTYPVPSLELLSVWRKQIGKRFFLFIGMLRYYKGLHILLEALKYNNYPVVIVGSGTIENQLKVTAMEYGLNNVHFLGSLSDENKVALLKLCYAIVFPSHLRAEAFGVSLLEGAMYGKPMISSEIGTGTSYVNIHNETGLIVSPGNSCALKEAMNFLWENPALAKKFGIQAEQRYWRLFTAKSMANQYFNAYQSFLSNMS